MVPLIVLAALPATVWAQDKARVSTVALTGVREKPAPNRTSTIDLKPLREPNRSSHHAAKSAAKEKKMVKLRKGAAPPRFTFEQRAARSFGPLSLTLPPDTHLDGGSTQFRAVDGSAAADKSQLATAPSDNTPDRITSAGIENLGLGHNLTVMVPLIQLLDKLSNQPPAAASPQ
ncbi:MAG TPA: hypothetical protein VH020_13595 [Stellaceae bacterium]|nr:hypothetical protein [Stellaceae bacterium]